jgi:hypothetical protein
VQLGSKHSSRFNPFQPDNLGLIRLRHESWGGSVLWRTLADKTFGTFGTIGTANFRPVQAHCSRPEKLTAPALMSLIVPLE